MAALKHRREKIILVSYNIRTSLFNEAEKSDKLNNYCYRKKALFNIIRRQNPDIICFQEDSQEQLEDLTYEFGDFFNIVSFSEAIANDNKEYVSIFIRKKFEIIDKHFLFISETPTIRSKLNESLFTRHLISVKCRLKGKSFTVINVHLDNSEDSLFKEKEARTFLKIFKKNFQKDHNVIVAGDFNFSTDDNKAYKKVSEKFIDISKVLNIREPTHPNWLMWNNYKQIDYCWLKKGSDFWIRDFQIVKDKYKRKEGLMIEPSDHFLIKCVLTI